MTVRTCSCLFVIVNDAGGASAKVQEFDRLREFVLHARVQESERYRTNFCVGIAVLLLRLRLLFGGIGTCGFGAVAILVL